VVILRIILPTRFKLALFAIAALAGVFLGEWHILVLFACAMLAVPLGLFMAVWLVMGLRRDAEVPIGLERTFRACMTAVGCLLVSLLSAWGACHYQMQKAHSYVASLAPPLDEYRSKTGNYPASLAEIQAPSPPGLLSHKHSYHGDKGSYGFVYWAPFPAHRGRAFDSRTQRWEDVDF
jgi:hypothetical protein